MTKPASVEILILQLHPPTQILCMSVCIVIPVKCSELIMQDYLLYGNHMNWHIYCIYTSFCSICSLICNVGNFDD